MKIGSKSLQTLLADKFALKIFTILRKRATRDSRFRGIVVPVDDLIGHNLMATGCFEATQFDGVDTLLKQTHLAHLAKLGRFVDVGANIGLYSLAFSDRFASTLAVEANPQTFLVLRANLALRTIGSVTPICVGASNKPGEAQLHVPINGNLGWATLDEAHHTVPTKALPISIRRLDDIMEENEGPAIVLLKIDVEGHEQSVLEGAEKTLRNDGPIVLFEVLGEEAGRASARLLQDCGYAFFYTFRRDWPEGKKKLHRVWRGLRSGLPVTIDAIQPDHLHKAALVCASKSALA